MAFQITNKNASGKQVKWRFENTENIYTSDVERFKRNVQFWMKKLNMAPTTQVELLEGAQWLQDHMAEEKNVVDVEHEEVVEDSLLVEMSEEFNELIETLENDEPTIDSTPNESDSNESAKQSDLFEDLESDVDTAKPKSRKKATNV